MTQDHRPKSQVRVLNESGSLYHCKLTCTKISWVAVDRDIISTSGLFVDEDEQSLLVSAEKGEKIQW